MPMNTELGQVYKLLSDINNWSPEHNAIDINGNLVSPTAENAVKWSMLGAVYKCYGQYTRYDRGRLVTGMMMMGYRPIDPHTFNRTHYYRTILEVVRLSGL